MEKDGWGCSINEETQELRFQKKGGSFGACAVSCIELAFTDDKVCSFYISFLEEQDSASLYGLLGGWIRYGVIDRSTLFINSSGFFAKDWEREVLIIFAFDVDGFPGLLCCVDEYAESRILYDM